MLRLFRDDADGVGGIVAADIEEGADLMRLQHLENLVAIFGVGLVAGRAERGGRRIGHHFEIVAGLLGQIEEILVDDAAHAVMGAIDALDAGEFARLQHHARERLVDDGGRAAALGDENFLRRHEILPSEMPRSSKAPEAKGKPVFGASAALPSQI